MIMAYLLKISRKDKRSKGHNYQEMNLFPYVKSNISNNFRDLFQSIALSVNWQEEYHTISDHTRTISQMSF